MAEANQKKLIKTLREFFQKEEGVLFCYLFGSQATERTNSESDVDLGLFFDENKIDNFFNKRIELIVELSKTTKKEVDVVVLNNASPFLRFVILKEGKLIFEKSKDQRIDFELKALNEYFDFKPILERYNQKLLNS